MSFEFRSTKDNFDAVLTQAVAVADTTLKSDAFVNLPTDLSSGANGKYIPAVLGNTPGGAYETVWISGHSSGSDTVTVVRGKEGTTNQAWPANTRIAVAPTSRDVPLVVASTAIPPDLHIGATVVRPDKLDVAAKGKFGLVPQAGVAFAGDIGGNLGGTTPADGAVMVFRSAHIQVTSTTPDGNCAVTYRTPFPNATAWVGVTDIWDGSASEPNNLFKLNATSASGFNVTVYDKNGARRQGLTFKVHYLALGW